MLLSKISAGEQNENGKNKYDKHGSLLIVFALLLEYRMALSSKAKDFLIKAHMS